MPAVSRKQEILFHIAESIKEGKTKKKYSPEAEKIAKSLMSSKIKEFTHVR